MQRQSSLDGPQRQSSGVKRQSSLDGPPRQSSLEGPQRQSSFEARVLVAVTPMKGCPPQAPFASPMCDLTGISATPPPRHQAVRSPEPVAPMASDLGSGGGSSSSSCPCPGLRGEPLSASVATTARGASGLASSQSSIYSADPPRCVMPNPDTTRSSDATLPPTARAPPLNMGAPAPPAGSGGGTAAAAVVKLWQEAVVNEHKALLQAVAAAAPSAGATLEAPRVPPGATIVVEPASAASGMRSDSSFSTRLAVDDDYAQENDGSVSTKQSSLPQMPELIADLQLDGPTLRAGGTAVSQVRPAAPTEPGSPCSPCDVPTVPGSPCRFDVPTVPGSPCSIGETAALPAVFQASASSGDTREVQVGLVAVPLAPGTSGDTKEAAECSNGIRLRREESEHGSISIAVEDADGSCLGTFGEESISFELRCKDPRNIERWLEGIETNMLPGLLTLLASEVARRTKDPAFAKASPRLVSWNAEDRLSMVDAHGKLREQLLGLIEVRNALAG